MRKRSIAVALGFSGFFAVGVLRSDDAASVVQHAECTFFGANHDKFVSGSTREAIRHGVISTAGMPAEQAHAASALTAAVVAGLPPAPPGTRTGSIVDPATASTIDRYIFQALNAANVSPAPQTTDYEFIRRVTLDLTGRIPTASQVTSFVADTSSDKRAKY